MMVNAIIEKLASEIVDSAIKSGKVLIIDKKVENERRKRIEGLLEKIKDTTFYNALDKYITNGSIVNKMVLYCDDFANKDLKVEHFLNDIVLGFTKQNRNLNYIDKNYVTAFFLDMFNEIFSIRYDYGKYSSQEVVIANLSRKIEQENLEICKILSNFKEQIQKMYSKISKNDSISNDKKFQFVEKYNCRLFLEENDKNAIRLKDIYITPRYRENKENKKNVDQYIDNFLFDQDEDNVLFIVGQPTAGKSSLVCDLINRYRYRKDIVALQFKELDESKNLITALKSKLQYNDQDFANKVLILDGFDEAKICKNQDISHIDKICRDFINELQSLLPKNTFFKVVLTIRTDFFKMKWKDDYDKVRVIELLEFDRDQIKEFQRKYKCIRSIVPQIEKFIYRESSNRVSGIVANPMMLYMICCYQGDLSCALDKAGIYDNIFSKNGPLFSNLYKGKGRAESKEDVEKYYNIVGKIAFQMFVKDTLTISEQEVKTRIPEIDNNLNRFTGMAILSKDNGRDNQIECIHSTICAYFAAKHIYCQILSIYQLETQNKEDILKKIDVIFSRRNIEGEVLEFLQYFISKGDICIQEEKFKTLLNATSYILERNCIYDLKLECDITLLERIHNAFNGYWKVFTAIYFNISRKKFLLNDLFSHDKNIWRNLGRLLKNGYFNKIYLRGADFSGIDLRCAMLKYADISFAKLSNSDVRGASLVGAKLSNTNLDNANFNGADLCKADLCGASLKKLKVRGSVLKECKFKNNKNVCGIKFSYSNIFYVQNIKEDDLKKCFVYDRTGRMKPFEIKIEMDAGGVKK